jgi:hypothetical protein
VRNIAPPEPENGVVAQLQRLPTIRFICTQALLRIVPLEAENGGSIVETRINSVYALGVMHVFDLMC